MKGSCDNTYATENKILVVGDGRLWFSMSMSINAFANKIIHIEHLKKSSFQIKKVQVEPWEYIYIIVLLCVKLGRGIKLITLQCVKLEKASSNDSITLCGYKDGKYK